jgi:molybdopterin converting factor small subunit
VKVRLVVTGRAYHTAEHLPDELDMPDGASLDDVLSTLVEQCAPGSGLSGSCLVAISGRHLGTLASHEPAILRDGDELALIAPVAGG